MASWCLGEWVSAAESEGRHLRSRSAGFSASDTGKYDGDGLHGDYLIQKMALLCKGRGLYNKKGLDTKISSHLRCLVPCGR